MTMVCPTCGSTNIQLMHWVDQLTGKVLDDCGSGCFCNECRGEQTGTGTLGYPKAVAKGKKHEHNHN